MGRERSSHCTTRGRLLFLRHRISDTTGRPKGDITAAPFSLVFLSPHSASGALSRPSALVLGGRSDGAAPSGLHDYTQRSPADGACDREATDERQRACGCRSRSADFSNISLCCSGSPARSFRGAVGARDREATAERWRGEAMDERRRECGCRSRSRRPIEFLALLQRIFCKLCLMSSKARRLR